jgi:hypothetical protein
MMKKLLVFMLVLGMATMANAYVIEVVTDGTGDAGHAGTSGDPLVIGETIYIQIVLNNNPYPLYPSYDGYVTDGMDLDLHVSGPGTLDVPGIYGAKSPYPRIGDDVGVHEDWDVWSQSGQADDPGTTGVNEYEPMIVSNQIAQLMGGSFGYILGKYGPEPLVWNLYITASDEGEVLVDLTLGGTTHVWDFSTPSDGPYGTVYDAVEEDLGDLTIYTVPEPTTVALLGLGGLLLLRRRK